jgi:hypothetical protein
VTTNVMRKPEGMTPAKVAPASVADAAQIALRPRGVMETIDLSLRFMVVHWRMYATLSALVLLPTWVLHAVVAAKVGIPVLLLMWIPSALAVRAVFTLLAAVLVFERGLTLRIFRARLAATLGPIIRFAFLTFLFAGAVSALASSDDKEPILITFSVGFLPVVAVIIMQYFALEVTLLERSSFFQSFKRSRALVSGGAIDAAGGLLVLTGLHALAFVLGDVGGRALITDLLMIRGPEALWTQGVTTLSLLGFWLAVPFVATTRFLLYVNVRTVMEGWDIQTQFMRIAASMREDNV